MVEKSISKISTPRDLMRDINYMFDENVFLVEATDVGLSSGIPVEVLESKGRLLNSIAVVSASTIGTEPSNWVEQENTWLRIENYALRERMRVVEERVSNIEALIPKERVIILQEISKEAAKEQIRNLFSTGRTLYYSDIAEELRLDLEMVVEICNELKESEEISIDASVS